ETFLRDAPRPDPNLTGLCNRLPLERRPGSARSTKTSNNVHSEPLTGTGLSQSQLGSDSAIEEVTYGSRVAAVDHRHPYSHHSVGLVARRLSLSRPGHGSAHACRRIRPPLDSAGNAELCHGFSGTVRRRRRACSIFECGGSAPWPHFPTHS